MSTSTSSSPTGSPGRAGWRQLFRDIGLEAGYHLNHYFADDDRAQATDRPSLSLELSWDRFVVSGQRLGLGLEVPP
jgi:hypothetical protein